ncbi:MAG: hypothetical protein AB8I08_31110 [Sandaracinaceae bacterium]
MRRCVLLLVLTLALSAGCDDDRTGGTDGGPTPSADSGLDGGATGTDAGGTGTDAGPVGGGGIGDPCSSDAQCTDPPDATCFTEIMNPFTGATIASYPNGFCSKGCEASEDCGSSERATCVSQGSSGGGGGSSSMTCTLSCESDADCRQAEGYRCQTLLGFGFCTP